MNKMHQVVTLPAENSVRNRAAQESRGAYEAMHNPVAARQRIGKVIESERRRECYAVLSI